MIKETVCGGVCVSCVVEGKVEIKTHLFGVISIEMSTLEQK